MVVHIVELSNPAEPSLIERLKKELTSGTLQCHTCLSLEYVVGEEAITINRVKREKGFNRLTFCAILATPS